MARGVAKELKLKVRKFWGLIPSFEKVTWETLVGGLFDPNFQPHPTLRFPFLIRKRVMVKQAQEATDNQFLFQNVQNNEIFGIFKMFKNNRSINVYNTKSKRL